MHSPPFVSNCRHFFLSPPLFCCISHASYLGHCSYPRWLDLIYNSPYCSCHSLFLLISAALVFTGRDLFCSSCPAYESLSPLYYSWPIHQSFLSFSFPPFSLSFLLPSFIVASYSLPSTLFIHYADILLTYIIIYWLSFSFFLPFPFLLFYISIYLFTFTKFVIPLLPIILNGELYICIIFPEPRSFPLSFKKGRFKSYTTADLNVLSTLATTFNQPSYVMTNPDQSNNLATTHDPTTQQKPFARVSVSYTKSNNATMNSCLLLSIQSFADGTPLWKTIKAHISWQQNSHWTLS